MKIEKFWSLLKNMTKEKKIFQPLTSENICEIYNILHKEGLVAFPATPESRNKIEAVVANVNGSNFGIQNYSTHTEKIVAYLYFLIKNHPFVDGNKRTAVLSFLVLCNLNGVREHLEGYDLDALAIFLEQLQDIDHQKIIDTVAKEIFSGQ